MTIDIPLQIYEETHSGHWFEIQWDKSECSTLRVRNAPSLMKQKSSNIVWMLNCCQLKLGSWFVIFNDIIECSALEHKADVI